MQSVIASNQKHKVVKKNTKTPFITMTSKYVLVLMKQKKEKN